MPSFWPKDLHADVAGREEGVLAPMARARLAAPKEPAPDRIERRNGVGGVVLQVLGEQCRVGLRLLSGDSQTGQGRQLLRAWIREVGAHRCLREPEQAR